MSALFHANVRIEGGANDLAAFKTSLAPLLLEHAGAATITENHLEFALSYDLKAAGGIPFPPFVMASGLHPSLTISVTWINAEANVRGAATIVNGALTEQQTEELPGLDGRSQFYISTGDDGALELALTFFQSGADEYCGYALTATRDALFRIARDEQRKTGDLIATAGAAEWAERWLIDLEHQQAAFRAIEPPLPIETPLYDQASRVMTDFIARWIWFAADPPEQIIVERARFERLGYAVRDANMKAAYFREIGGGGQLSRLGADTEWIKDAVERYWMIRE